LSGEAVAPTHAILDMEIVPEASALQDISPATMVKSVFQPEVWLSSSVKPLFTNLISFEMRKAMSTYTDRKDRLIRAEIEKLDDATALCQGTLVSLNLPASIEALESTAGIPENLERKLFDAQNRGGMGYLNQTWEALVMVRERVSYSLDAAVKVLDDEERDDLGFRSQYQDRWTRLPSRELTRSIRQNADTYREKLVTAKKSDQLVRGKIDANLSKLLVLSSSQVNLYVYSM
jgi:programmed cell death 6-interacting protein